jgi:hypothetical protein
MSKLLSQHLPALLSEFVKAMQEGAIMNEQAREFADAIYNAVLEQEVKDGRSGHYAARPPRASISREASAGAQDGDDDNRPRIVPRGVRRRR